MSGKSEPRDFALVTSSLSFTVRRRFRERSWRIGAPSECTGGEFTESESIRGQDDTTTLEIPEEDIEGPWTSENQEQEPGIRQEFDVTYIRNKKTNSWCASTKRGKLYRGVKAKGAVGYTTGGGKEKEKATRIMRLSLCSWNVTRIRVMHIPVRFQTAWPAMVRRAEELADRMFMTRHPEAEIEHDEEDG